LRVYNFTKEDIEFWPKIMEVLNEENAPFFVLDLRGNGGGNRDAGSELMRFLSDDKFGYSILQPKGKPKPFLNKQGKRYYRFSKLKYNVGKFTHKKKTDLGKAFEFEFKPNETVYKGQIIVMTDGITASTSTMLTTWLDKHSNALFVGRKTGGGYNGNNGGVFPRITLPFSKTIIRFPSYRIVLDDDYKKEDGLMPDVEVVYSVEDYLQKRDKDWEAVLNLILTSK
jgi:C-terminal processing protease CtpA/Prc